MPKTILLTGATGFLGSHLLEALLREKYQVVILKRSTSDTWRIAHLLERMKSYDVDKGPVSRAFEDQRIDVVMHTACHYGRNADPLSAVVQTNILFGLQVLEASMQFNADTFFNADTLLPKYLNTYTLSKKQFVEWLRQNSSAIQVVNMKLEHMYGPKDDEAKFIPWILSQFDAKVPEIKLTLGQQQRDFIYVDDVVSAYLKVLQEKESLPEFSEFDVGTGELVRLQEFLVRLKKVYEGRFGFVPTELRFGAIPYRQGEMMSVEVDNRRLLKLGWNWKFDQASGIERLLGVNK